jgi:hypothetical protein
VRIRGLAVLVVRTEPEALEEPEEAASRLLELRVDPGVRPAEPEPLVREDSARQAVRRAAESRRRMPKQPAARAESVPRKIPSRRAERRVRPEVRPEALAEL